MRYVLARPDLIFVFVVAFAAGTFGLNFQMTTALMATGEFHKGAGEYGLLGSMMAIGSLTGALLAARRGYPRRLVLVLAALAFALAEIAAGLMPTYWMFACWLPVVGITALTLLNSLQTVVQLSVDADIRGRVVALYMMIADGRYAVRRAGHRLGRRDLRAALDADRRRPGDSGRRARSHGLADAQAGPHRSATSRSGWPPTRVAA